MKFLPSALILMFFMVTASRVEAHAFLDHAEPAVGSRMPDSPAVVKLWFTRHLKPGLSTFQVFNAGEQEVDERDAKIDSNDPSLIMVSVPKLTAGTYKVTWKAVCLDGHMTHGNFTFEVTSL